MAVGAPSWRRRLHFQLPFKFLKLLANRLHIVPKDVIVVPGNHDVDWDPGLTQRERFKHYMRAVADFTSPVFNGGDPKPVIIPFTEAEGIDVEILALISPTLSGLPADESENRDKTGTKVNPPNRPAHDIAAIGPVQCKIIRSFPPMTPDQRPIRIALQHHHLLPDTGIEITHFESVLDSGRVLDALIRHRFDLVLTGHKHNRRLVTYNHGEQVLDVYCGPSLFEGQRSGVYVYRYLWGQRTLLRPTRSLRQWR